MLSTAMATAVSIAVATTVVILPPADRPSNKSTLKTEQADEEERSIFEAGQKRAERNT